MLSLTIIFYCALAFWTILMGVLSLPFIFLPSKYIPFSSKNLDKRNFIFLRYICGVTHEIKGLDNLSDEQL